MAINTIKATIQMRKGLERDFDSDQMTAGEWAVSTDTKYVRMCFAPGIVLRMATYEGFEIDMEEVRDILKECRDIQVAVDAMAKLAEKHKNDAEKSAKLSESWAKGETGVRTGENTNNSKYFSGLAEALVSEAEKLLDQAQKVITASTQGALIPGGTVAFQDLPTNPAVGFMYNISNDFTTDIRFEDGAGIFYRAGANVYWTSGGKWDVLIGTQVTGVKGAKESVYRVGNVNLTPANIGAMDAEAGSVLQEEVDNIRRDYWSLKSGTKIKAGDNLNNYTTPGNYICDSAAIVRSLLNSPFENATPQNTFNMKVYLAASNNESKKWVAQRIITWGTGQEFYRYALDENAQSFSEWIKISDNLDNYYSLTGGVEYTNDTQPDLNTIITPGNYFAYSVTISQSQIDDLHFPVTCSAYTLKVESTVGRGNYFTQIFKPYQSNYMVYERHKFGNSEWTNWILISGNMNNYWSLSGGTAIPENADLNNYSEVGSYYCISEDYVKTLLNCPTKKPFTMKIFFSRGVSYRAQELKTYDKGEVFFRYYEFANNLGWTKWTNISGNLNNYQSLTQFTEIPEGADMKSSAYLVPGNYSCKTDTIANKLTNCPVNQAFVMEVSYALGTTQYIKQTIRTFTGSEKIERVYNQSAKQWISEYKYTGGYIKKLIVQKTDVINLENISVFQFAILKQNNVVTLSLNIGADMIASSTYKTIYTLPSEYRPEYSMIENYITQEGYAMGVAIDQNTGAVSIYNNNKAISGWIIRKIITYICKE